MPQKIERPAWLMPSWLALTSHGNGCPVYVDSAGIRSVSGRAGDVSIVHLAGGGSLVVMESADEVIMAIGRATA